MMTVMVMMYAHVRVGGCVGIRFVQTRDCRRRCEQCRRPGRVGGVGCAALGWAEAARITEIPTAAALQGWLQVLLAWDTRAEAKRRELKKKDAQKSKVWMTRCCWVCQVAAVMDERWGG
jgi:hypothetical protein